MKNLLLVLGLISSFSFAEIRARNFLNVSGEIFRSGRPSRSGLREMQEEHGLRTIINLEDDFSQVRREENWAEDLDINYYSIPMGGWETPEDEDVNEALALLARPGLHPILIHCFHGQDRTGLVVGLHRVEHQGWEAQAAYDEMLEIGFRTFLFNLDNYFKERTGLDENILRIGFTN